MKEYNKDKLHEYAKELFALCLDKGFDFRSDEDGYVFVGIGNGSSYVKLISNISDEYYDYKNKTNYPIWELIEKVKQL